MNTPQILYLISTLNNIKIILIPISIILWLSFISSLWTYLDTDANSYLTKKVVIILGCISTVLTLIFCLIPRPDDLLLILNRPLNL